MSFLAFSRDRQGRGWCCVREELVTELVVGDDTVESRWLRIKGQANKADVTG